MRIYIKVFIVFFLISIDFSVWGINYDKREIFRIPSAWVSKIRVDRYKDMIAAILVAGNDVYYSCSEDAGKEWLRFSKINEFNSIAADVIFDNRGNVYFFWSEVNKERNNLSVAKYINGCRDNVYKRVIAEGLADNGDVIAKYKVGKLAVAFSQKRGKARNFILQISYDGGKKWTSERIINRLYSENWKVVKLDGLIDYEISDDGYIYIAGIRGREQKNGIFFSYSTDDAVYLSKPVVIRKKTIALNCHECILRSPENNINLLVEGNKIYIIYRVNKGKKFNLYGIYSNDRGKSWKKPVLLNKDLPFIIDYSVLIKENYIDLLAFRKDNEVNGLYYFKIKKSSFGEGIYSFLFDNNGAFQLIKDNKEGVFFLFSKWDGINNSSIIYSVELKTDLLIDNDTDRDGLPDEFEDKLLKKFKPHWHINGDDPAGVPVRLKENEYEPSIADKDGTIYGQVFRLDRCMEKICQNNECSCRTYYFLEMHYISIWEDDKLVWPFSQHMWDKEHISARAVHTGLENPNCELDYMPSDSLDILWDMEKWKVDLWEFYAHQGTPCEKVRQVKGSFEKGIDVWVSYKHGIFPSLNGCNKFLRFWCPDACFGDKNLGSPDPINIGEPFYPINKAYWIAFNAFLLGKMDPDLPLLKCR